MDIKQWVVSSEHMKAVNVEPSVPLARWFSPKPIRLTTELRVLAPRWNLTAEVRGAMEEFEARLAWEPVEAWESIKGFAPLYSFELTTGLEGEWLDLMGETPLLEEALPRSVHSEVAVEEEAPEIRFQAPAIENGLRDLPSLWNQLPGERPGRVAVVLWRLRHELERVAQQATAAVEKTARDLANSVQSLLNSLLLPPPQPAMLGGAIPVSGEPIRTRGGREIETIILDRNWETKGRRRFPVADGPRIREGELELKVAVDPAFAGRLADLVLVADPLEVALGFTEINPPKRGEKATVEFRVDLKRAGIKVRDGNLPVEKLFLVIEPPSEAEIGGGSNG